MYNPFGVKSVAIQILAACLATFDGSDFKEEPS
jgi:hypothetical protein